MQSVVRAASLGQLSRATSTAVPNLLAPVSSEGGNLNVPGIKLEPTALPLTAWSMSKQLPKGGQTRITSGLGGWFLFYLFHLKKHKFTKKLMHAPFQNLLSNIQFPHLFY